MSILSKAAGKAAGPGAEDAVEQVSSGLRKRLKGLLGGRGKAYGSPSLPRTWQLGRAQSLFDELHADLAQYVELDADALGALRLVAEQVSRLLAAAVDGRLHEDSLNDLGGYLVLFAAALTGQSPEAVLEA